MAKSDVLERARELKPQLVALRRAIHRFPELGFEVRRTADLVAQTLYHLGIEFQMGVGKTGVVATIGETPGPVIALRADMDALPIQEVSEVSYASEVPGVMHACGHDAHTAMLLGAAMLLHEMKFDGQIRLLFQPSEEAVDSENKSGAQRMLEDGALKGVNAAVALHVDGRFDAGKISITHGPATAAVDTFQATIVGHGGHGAYPHTTTDPIWLTTQVLNALYSIPSRHVNPASPVVVTVGQVHGGTASNVIPDRVFIEGTLRSYTDDVRGKIVEEVKRALEMVRAFGGTYDLSVGHGYPSTMNAPGVAEVVKEAGLVLLGDEGLSPWQQGMGGEDFSFVTREVPSAFFRLGVRQPGGPVKHLHTANFDIDEDALPIGSAVLAQAALWLLVQQHE